MLAGGGTTRALPPSLRPKVKARKPSIPKPHNPVKGLGKTVSKFNASNQAKLDRLSKQFRGDVKSVAHKVVTTKGITRSGIKKVLRPGKTAAEMWALQHPTPKPVTGRLGRIGGKAVPGERGANLPSASRRPKAHIVNYGTTKSGAPKPGARSRADIISWQRRLNAKGANLVVDGIWGPRTQAAYTKLATSPKTKYPAKKVNNARPLPPKGKPRTPAPKGNRGGGPVAPTRGGGGGGGKSLNLAGGALRGTSAGSTAVDKTSDQARAKASVDMVLNPMLNAIKRQTDTARKQFDRMSSEEKGNYQRQQADLEETYKRLGTYINGQKSGTDQVYEDARARVRSAYNDLDSALNQDYDRSKGNVDKETQRLGIGQISGSAKEGLNRDQSFLSGIVGANRENADRALTTRKSSYDALSSLMSQGAASESASRKSESERLHVKNAADIYHKRADALGELSGKYADIAGTRGERVKQALDALRNARDEKEAEQAQQAWMNAMAESKFGLETQKFDLAKTVASTNASNQKAKLALEADRLKVAKDNAAAKSKAQAQAKNKAPKGYQAAGAYISKAVGTGKRANDLTAIMNLALNGDNGKATTSKKNKGWGFANFKPHDVSSMDLMMRMGKVWLRDNGYKKAEEDLLYKALMIYFGKF